MTAEMLDTLWLGQVLPEDVDQMKGSLVHLQSSSTMGYELLEPELDGSGTQYGVENSRTPLSQFHRHSGEMRAPPMMPFGPKWQRTPPQIMVEVPRVISRRDGRQKK